MLWERLQLAEQNAKQKEGEEKNEIEEAENGEEEKDWESMKVVELKVWMEKHDISTTMKKPKKVNRKHK